VVPGAGFPVETHGVGDLHAALSTKNRPRGRSGPNEQMVGSERKLSKGFAHRFRPTYPGFPVEAGGVEQLRAAFFERKPHARHG
jgi:hypothetical protein